MTNHTNAPGHGRDYSEAANASEGSIRASQPITQVAPRPFLSAAEVADLSGLSRQAVYRAIRAGELEASRVRSRLRIHLRAVAEWMERGKVQAQAATPHRGAPSAKPTGMREQLRDLTTWRTDK